MITRIEINNFQSHKHTSLDFSKGVNVFLGESDNGKTVIIRAIRWVAENRPLGTDKLNSSWNDKFKEDMSVKLFLDDGSWVERVRNKTLNGYRYSKDGKDSITLEATGTDVPQVISDILRLSEVNFQFQMDPPYLLSMSSLEVSKYFNRIIHLDTIDKTLSLAESDKRSLNSERKVVESDIKKYKAELGKLEWLDNAEILQMKVDKYEEILRKKSDDVSVLMEELSKFSKYNSDIVDYSKHNSLIKEIEGIVIGNCSELESSINEFEKLSKDIKNYSKHNSLIKEIEGIVIGNCSELESSISEYVRCEESIGKYKSMSKALKDNLPDVCPLCGNVLDKDNFEEC